MSSKLLHNLALIGLMALLWLPGPASAQTEYTVNVLTFNIWTAEGSTQGRQQIADTILASGADLVGVQELNAASDGQAILALLGSGWFYQHQGGDVAVYSRYPLIDTAPNAWGVKVELAPGHEAWIFNVHLNHAPYGPYQINGIPYLGGTLYDPNKKQHINRLIRDQEQARGSEIASALDSMDQAGALAGDIPAFLVGDFNEPSHLDWTEDAETAGVHVVAVAWPTSQEVTTTGMLDAWREVYPDEVNDPGDTWSPVFDADYINQEVPEPQDRIDFVYAIGEGVTATDVQTLGPTGGLIDEDIELNNFPSDHRAMVATYTVTYSGGPATPDGTVLTFTGLPHNPGNDAALNAGYGDNAAGTPDVTVAFSASNGDTWDTYTGGNWDAVGQLQYGNGLGRYELAFTPAPSVGILVESFDLLDWQSGTGHTVLWELIGDDGTGPIVIASDTVTIRRRKTLHVETGLTDGFDGDVTLRLTHQAGVGDSLAIDNIAFKQTEAMAVHAPLTPVLID